MYIFSFVGIIFMDIIFSGRIKNLPEGKQLFEAADFPSEGFSVFYAILVHRFVNNYTNRVGYGFECAGLKTQA